MNLRELNSGTSLTKPWLTPVVGSLDCQTLTCENLSLMSGSVPSQIFSQTATSTNTANTNEVDTIGTGVGTLTVPAGHFVEGSTGVLKFEGTISTVASTSLTLRLFADGFLEIGTVVLTASGTSTAKKNIW